MYKIKLLSALILTLFLSACNKDSDDNDNTPAPANINGEWKLVNVTDPESGIDDDFTPGVIKWTFTSTTNTLEVEETNPDTSQELVLPTGTYIYSIEDMGNETSCGTNFYIDDIDFGCFNLTATQLKIGYEGEYVITLVR